MNCQKHILLVEDDANLSFMTKDYLEYCGYTVDCTGYGENVNVFLDHKLADLIILDVELEGRLNGFDVAQNIRSRSHVPIVFTTCHSSQEDLSKVFNIENTDYIRKPYTLHELVLRMKRFLENQTIKNKNVQIGFLNVDPEGRTLSYGDNTYNINNQELKLLMKLVEQPNRIVPKEELLLSVWPDQEDVKSKEISLNNLICALRKIFGLTDSRITIDNIRGYGYKLSMQQK